MGFLKWPCGELPAGIAATGGGIIEERDSSCAYRQKFCIPLLSS